jgi:V/A-type H+-transporting ATPase subunit G/H
MKTEILKSIKQAEEEYKSLISGAQESKKRDIANAIQEEENLIAKAKVDAEEYKKTRLAQARGEASEKYEGILKEGSHRTAALKNQAETRKDSAVELLVSRFKEKLDV